MRLLHTTAGYGSHRYYADGRRITQAKYHDLFDASNRKGKISCSQTVRKNGQWYFYVQAGS